MPEIKIIQKPENNKPFLVIYKPKDLPSAPLLEDETETALSQAIRLYPDIKNVKGKKAIEYGLLHRIDTPTDGLLLIALTQDFYDYMLEEQKQNRFIKEYSAECDVYTGPIPDGFPKLEKTYEKLSPGTHFQLKSYFRNFGEGSKSVRPVTEESGKAALKKLKSSKEYITEVEIIDAEENKVKVKCKITQGYRHQVRCHLAWAGLPIIGDTIYNIKDDSREENLHFCATGLYFTNSVTKLEEKYNLNC